MAGMCTTLQVLAALLADWPAAHVAACEGIAAHIANRKPQLRAGRPAAAAAAAGCAGWAGRCGRVCAEDGALRQDNGALFLGAIFRQWTEIRHSISVQAAARVTASKCFLCLWCAFSACNLWQKVHGACQDLQIMRWQLQARPRLTRAPRRPVEGALLRGAARGGTQGIVIVWSYPLTQEAEL